MEYRKFLVLCFCRLAIILIEFDVAGKDNVAPRRLENDTHRVGDSMCDVEKADRGVSHFDDLIFLDFADHELREVREFLLAFLYHHAGKLPRVYRRIADSIEHIGNAADVVEVTVRYEHSADFVSTLFKVARVL